jgi:bifunctional DNA-binding transcriptional regulator/antitoxin component of YhaV-PrlF toxin-antitoxin module
MKLKLNSIGQSTEIILPKAMLQRLNLKAGDSVFATAVRGGYLLTPYDPEITEQMEIGLRFMKRHKTIFRALASPTRPRGQHND